MACFQFIWHVSVYMASVSLYGMCQFIWHVFILYLYGIFLVYMACFSIYGMFQYIWYVLVYMACFQFIWHVFKLYDMAFLDPKNVFCHQQNGFSVFFW